MKEEIAQAQQQNDQEDEEESSEDEEEKSPLNIDKIQVSRYPQSMKQSIDFDQQYREEKAEGPVEDGYCVDDTEQSEHENPVSHRTNQPSIDIKNIGTGLASPQKLGLHISKESISNTKSQYEITVKRSHHQNVQNSEMINIEDDEEEDPLPRDDSPLKAQQNVTNATTPTITPNIIPSRALATPQGENRVVEPEDEQP